VRPYLLFAGLDFEGPTPSMASDSCDEAITPVSRKSAPGPWEDVERALETRAVRRLCARDLRVAPFHWATF
jgi:hypothetical protein